MLELEAELARERHEMDRRRAELDSLRERAAQDVDQVHRQYRRDLVPLNQAVVLYTDQQRRGR